MKKIGIMGGTFNPIHIGHLIVAQNAFEQLHLDKVLFMPSKKPPHKSMDLIVEETHRKNMIQLAIEGNPAFEFSDFEYNRQGTTYTSDTVTQLSMEHPDTKYYFILGADSLHDITKWHLPETIFEHCELIAAMRHSLSEQQFHDCIEHLRKTYHAKIHLISMPYVDISSHLIREKCTKQESIRYLVPDRVMEYVKIKQLYQTEEDVIS